MNIKERLKGMHTPFEKLANKTTRMNLQLKLESNDDLLYHSAFRIHELPTKENNVLSTYTQTVLKRVSSECDVNIPQHMLLQAHNILSKPTTSCETTELKNVDEQMLIQCRSMYTDTMSNLSVGFAVIKTPSTVFVTKVSALHLQILHQNMKLSVFALLPPSTPTNSLYIENYIQEKTDKDTVVHDVTHLNQLMNRRTHNSLAVPTSTSHRSQRQQLKLIHANMMRNFVPVPTMLPSTLVLHSCFSACSTRLSDAENVTFHTVLFT